MEYIWTKPSSPQLAMRLPFPNKSKPNTALE